MVCALKIGEIVEEEDAVTTATEGGQQKEELESIRGQRLDLVGVEKARAEEVACTRRLRVCESASETRERGDGPSPDFSGLGRCEKG